MRYHDIRAAVVVRRRELIREGAGFWEDSDAAEKAREAREAMKDL